MGVADQLVRLSRRLVAEYAAIGYPEPVAYVYNPLEYAAVPHEAYLRQWGNSQRRVVFAGMNPGPFGMAQVGVPFGEISVVRDWLRVSGEVKRPAREHPRRPVLGFACRRSEVSGRRLWGLFANRFGTPEAFFADHFVINLCPLMFLDADGRNLTPDKLPAESRRRTMDLCCSYIRDVCGILGVRYVVAVGTFSAGVCEEATGVLTSPPEVVRILHPSPANPHANRDWAGTVTTDLQAAGVW